MPKGTCYVTVYDPRNKQSTSRIVSLYLAATRETLLLCRHNNQDGDVMCESDARNRYQRATADSKEAEIPYACSVCGFCVQ